jgi:hypothetical protein
MSGCKVPDPKIGEEFDRLTVKEIIPGKKYIMVRVVCKCGAERIVYKFTLLNGKSKSCGCLQKEAARRKNLTHGMARSSEYKIWQQMKERCTNPNNNHFKDYGGRGITVCERWLKFENFYADMGPRPAPKHELDRYPNQKGNYEPGNVRWATRKQQMRNRRNNRLVEFQGETRCMVEWSEIKKIPADIIRCRIRLGWTVERALGSPYSPRKTITTRSKQ